MFQIAQLDVEALSALGQLAVLDLQNNAIESVPPELGNLTQLRALQLEVEHIKGMYIVLAPL